ncbi:hypothetical protein F5B22DRAFT_623977 [Xylaria bambusicola]|uniref:uncharacterized protein n=1 Tax=Xylaria bambusicola TaxID=326684 RepID=UPI002008275A|nr:uncharacterized protein F5B22DRAFT_623977 [Xylaria bambusicola]KAI0506367.1 hypothetical protein F5B22DRAFT_623977 [Xylaria bambusicola]
MTVTRIFTFAIADAAAQDFAVSTFNGFKDSCKKNGASYIVATHAAKVKVLKDTSGSAAWTVYASITFQNEDDANYFANEDPVNQEVKAKNAGATSGFCVIQGSFS